MFASLKNLLCNSLKVWESLIRGMEVKCDEDLVVKIVTAKEEYTEYTTLEFLAKQAPDVVVSKPDGFDRFGAFHCYLCRTLGT